MKLCYLSPLLFLCTIYACKTADKKPESGAFAVFTHETSSRSKCGDLNSSARNIVHRALPKEHCAMPDTLVTGRIKQIGMVSRSPSSTGKEFGYRAIYDTGVMWTIMFRPVDGESGSMETWGYVSMPAKHKGDTVIESCLLQDMAALTPGCKRLSYYDSKQYSPRDITSTQADNEGYSMILFKGRYDAELN